MATQFTTRIEGGKKLEAAVQKALRATGVKEVQVGFFSTAKYAPDVDKGRLKEEFVAQVALKNEFGFNPPDEPAIPSRPFFRQALEIVEDDVRKMVEKGVDSTTMVADPKLADEVGLTVANAIQQRIVDLREPPNSPVTIQKKKSSNPLVDTGQMRLSVTWRAVK